ncbi:mfs multidrug transporter [Pyrenophora seminiperda CCB06]|uniref:Mfs multidrug transporter n=1 Tax=Pyrenophora seminiperda CCB06 TaxID=1302712 RepID=A0A3M7M683_9PLEO|nr:mfs multidrug transporter [Pyrenophora seminiperda CCB06]
MPPPPPHHQRQHQHQHQHPRSAEAEATTPHPSADDPASAPPTPPPPSPPFSLLHPTTPVSIILKQDQPTGHQVRGIIADILTRGDHPRGVKVRLRDGRVGRVQSIVSEAEGLRGEAMAGGAGAGSGRGRGVGDMAGLFRALEEADREFAERSGGGGGGPAAAAAAAGGGRTEVEAAVCPVCGVFEGDEAAVAHHVEEHFGE